MSGRVGGGDVGGAHIGPHPRVGGNRVYGRAAAHAADIERGFRISRYFEIRDLRNGAAHGLNRIGHSERTVTVSPWAFERYSIPHAANADIHDAQAVSTHGHELVDLARHEIGRASCRERV